MDGNASITGGFDPTTDGTATPARPPAALVASLVLALAGAGVAAYLTWVHYDMDVLVCGTGDCHAVQSSPYATVGPVPIALLGLGMFLSVVALSIARWRRPALRWPATLAAFLLVFASILYFAYLTWLELAVIGAICQWCVLSALITVGLLVSEGVQAAAEVRSPTIA